MIEDNRSKRFVLVPFCLLAQAYQAQGLVKYEWKGSIKPFVEVLLKNDINIIQMPCAESFYNDELIRKPKGISKYDTPEFNKHCEELAERVNHQIRNIIDGGYQVVAILGIEQSPTCCVNYIYTNKGMEKRKGLFMDKLFNKISDLDIPIIGINRKYIRKSLEQLTHLIEKTSK